MQTNEPRQYRAGQLVYYRHHSGVANQPRLCRVVCPEHPLTSHLWRVRPLQGTHSRDEFAAPRYELVPGRDFIAQPQVRRADLRLSDISPHDTWH